jgi:hypothetical protein
LALSLGSGMAVSFMGWMPYLSADRPGHM